MHTISEICRTTPLTGAINRRGLHSRRPVTHASTAENLGAVRSFARDQEIFGEGDPADFFYQVVCGTVRTYKLLIDGRRQIDAFHLQGDIFGIESGREHRFAAATIAIAQLRAFPRRKLYEMINSDPQATNSLFFAMTTSIERAQDHMLLLGRKCAREKIATFLLSMSSRMSDAKAIDLPMSRTDIADHLGLTIETVSRTLTQLQREHVIEIPFGRREIILQDVSALRLVSFGMTDESGNLLGCAMRQKMRFKSTSTRL